MEVNTGDNLLLPEVALDLTQSNNNSKYKLPPLFCLNVGVLDPLLPPTPSYLLLGETPVIRSSASL